MLAVSNISGPSQKTVHDFAEKPDNPPGFAAPQPQERSNLPAHCEEFYWLVRWFLASDESPLFKQVQNLLSELSSCDREEIRHEVAIQFWRKAISAESRGVTPTKSAKIVLAMLKRELQNSNKLPQTVAYVNHDEAKAAHELMMQKRIERLEADHIRIASQERAAAMTEVVPVQIVRF